MNHVQIKISFNSMCMKSIHHNNLHSMLNFLHILGNFKVILQQIKVLCFAFCREPVCICLVFITHVSI